MNISNVIEFVINSQNNNKMLGRKRLHKLILLGSIASNDECGETTLSESEFYIHHYGVYSKVVARSLDNLVFAGALIKKSEPLGVYGSYVDTYHKEAEVDVPSLKFTNVVKRLSSENTVLLEVAANIAFHLKSGKDLTTAKTETTGLKPIKSAKYLDKSLDLLKEIEIL